MQPIGGHTANHETFQKLPVNHVDRFQFVQVQLVGRRGTAILEEPPTPHHFPPILNVNLGSVLNPTQQS